MAEKSNVREGEKITFADGVEREIFPLTIRQLRKFLKLVKNMNFEMNTDEMSDEDIDKMVEVASLILTKDYAEFAADKEGLEDALDLKCFGELTAAAMGTDPNE